MKRKKRTLKLVLYKYKYFLYLSIIALVLYKQIMFFSAVFFSPFIGLGLCVWCLRNRWAQSRIYWICRCCRMACILWDFFFLYLQVNCYEMRKNTFFSFYSTTMHTWKVRFSLVLFIYSKYKNMKWKSNMRRVRVPSKQCNAWIWERKKKRSHETKRDKSIKLGEQFGRKMNETFARSLLHQIVWWKTGGTERSEWTK